MTINYINDYYLHLGQLLSSIDSAQIEKAVGEVKKCMANHGNIFIAGNGGSATTASHLANDLIKNMSSSNRQGVRIISLVDNLAMLTALSNDHCFTEIFEKQLKMMMKKGDLFIALSASGNSPNLIKACHVTQEMQNSCISITGFDGGELKKISNYNIHVESPHGEYQKIEDIHLSIAHLISSLSCCEFESDAAL